MDSAAVLLISVVCRQQRNLTRSIKPIRVGTNIMSEYLTNSRKDSNFATSSLIGHESFGDTEPHIVYTILRIMNPTLTIESSISNDRQVSIHIVLLKINDPSGRISRHPSGVPIDPNPSNQVHNYIQNPHCDVRGDYSVFGCSEQDHRNLS